MAISLPAPPVLRPTRLGDLLADQTRWAAAGIIAAPLMAPAGSYRRSAPIYLDMEAASASTRAAHVQFHTILDQHYPNRERVQVAGALVVGQGTLVLADGSLAVEAAAEFLHHGKVPDGLVRDTPERFRLGAPPSFTIGAPCLLLKRPWWRNFGHWLVDAATVMALLRQQIIDFNWSVVIGAHETPAMRRIMQETLGQIIPATRILEHRDTEVWHFADLHYPMPLHAPPQIKLPAGLAALRQAFVPAPVAGVKRLYLSRGDVGARRVVNEAALIPVLERFGFEVIHPASGQGLHAQAQLFASAEAVLGVKGAALTNVVFCRPEAKILVLSPADFADPFFWDIASQAGMAYAELFGPLTTDNASGLNDFTIDPARLGRMLEAVLGAPTAIAASVTAAAPVAPAPPPTPPAPPPAPPTPAPPAGTPPQPDAAPPADPTMPVGSSAWWRNLLSGK